MLLRGLIFKIDVKVDILWSDNFVICHSICIDLVILIINSEEISVLVDDNMFNALR